MTDRFQEWCESNNIDLPEGYNSDYVSDWVSDHVEINIP